ncbi:hypothetical protein [Maioricimonas sp. JC845]|uniref:hypothetical protein n=1 Tax=Maioricimonas sp. JC845 TaxID=3232138 RepID=UPI0034585040
MSAPTVRPPLLIALYNHNPFYVISVLLMLYAVRSAYGELEVGTINTGLMMGVLAGYTSLLAAIAVLIIRKGKVWEDARSIIVLLLLLFLAVSVTADDLFVRTESALNGALILLCGYIFSAVVMESVNFAAGIRLGIAYRIPYHLMFALLYLAPWWCSPELHPRTAPQLEWTIFLFPVVAAGLMLTLLPAARFGPAYANANGTPWRWPLFPWVGFGMLFFAVGMRTFALAMTFGQTGPIWIHLKSGGRAIAFDTMWGPYFLIPPVFAVLMLLLEGSLSTRNRRLTSHLLRWAPGLLLLALPYSSGPVFRGFLDRVTEQIGAPLWLSVLLLLGYYAYATLRRVPGAGASALATTLLLAVVGPQTTSLRTLTPVEPWPLFAVGTILAIAAVRKRSSFVATLAAVLLTSGLWHVLPETLQTRFRFSISYHLLWLSVIVLGLLARDRFAQILRIVGAAQMPLAAIVVMTHPAAADVPLTWRIGYVAAITVASIAIAQLWHSRWYLYAFTGMLGIVCYGIAVVGFRSAVSVLGQAAVTSFAWSLAALVAAFLISAHKAHWLPRRLFPRWKNGNGGAAATSTVEPPPDPTPTS